MNTHNRSNALLMELLIVILVFMLSSTLLMQIFAKVHELEDRAELTAVTLAEAQGQADRLYASEDPEQTLREMGFMQGETEWIYQGEGYTSTVTLSEGEQGLIRQELMVRNAAGDILLTLPCSRYREVTP